MNSKDIIIEILALQIFFVSIIISQSLLPPTKTGNFYVSNYNADNIVVYDSSGGYLREFTAQGLDGPRGIVYSDDHIYISSQGSDEVFILIMMKFFCPNLVMNNLMDQPV